MSKISGVVICWFWLASLFSFNWLRSWFWNSTPYVCFVRQNLTALNTNISNTAWISRSTSLEEKQKRPRSWMQDFVKRKRNYRRMTFARNKVPVDCRTQKSQSNKSVDCPILLKFIHLGKRMWEARKPSPGKTSTIMCLGRMALFASYMTFVVTSSRGPWPHSWGLVVLVIRTLFKALFKFVLMIPREDYLPWRPCTEEEHRCHQRRCFSTRSTFGFWLCPRDCLWYVTCLASTLPF